MDLEEIKNKLVNSCDNLNIQYDILDDLQNKQCTNNIGGKDYKINDNEYKIFGEKRNDKLKFYYDLLRKVKLQFYKDYQNGIFEF